MSNISEAVSETVKTALPWIGTALGGPLGGVAAGLVGKALGLSDSSVETVKAVLGGMPPEKLGELRLAELQTSMEMRKRGIESIEKLAELDAQVIESVNKTMQSETASEHWPSYSWRPFIGFMFGLYIASMWLLPLFGKTPVELKSDIVLAIGGILGVASWFRGKAQSDPEIQNTQTVTQKG